MLLPSGWFPRIAIAGAVLIAALLVLDLEFVRSSISSLLAANSADLGIVLLAAICAFWAAKRSSGYARQIWLLLAIALTLNTFAQAITTYYQTFMPESSQSPWPSDVLFFVWSAPAFMILLPRSEDDPSGIDSLRLLDFLQVAIVAVTIYVYFFYSPERWKNNPLSLLRQILLLYIARDAILSSAFFIRSGTSLPSWLRKFSLVLAVAFFAAVLSDVDYFFTRRSTASSASWGDLVWMLPYFTVILLAAFWKAPEPLVLGRPSSRLGAMVATQILPVATPLIVIFMSQVIAREQLLFAWLAVTASVLCSSIRLILTNRRQRRVSENLLQTERALRSSEEILATAFFNSPDAFSINVFPNGPYLEVNDGFARLTGYTREETLGKAPGEMNLWVDTDRRDQALATLMRSSHLRDFEFRFRQKSGQVRMGQMSASVIELREQRCTLVIVRDVTERREAEEILRHSEERFRSMVQNLQVGIVTYDPEGCIVFANQAVLELVGLSLEQIVGKNYAQLGIVALQEDGSPAPENLSSVPLVIASRKPIRGLLKGWRIPNRGDLWTLLDLVPEFSSTGELLRVVVSVTDLTQQRRAVEALRESEERYRTLVENLHVGIMIYDPQLRIVFANQGIPGVFGRPADFYVGKSLDQFDIVTIREDGTEVPPEARPVSVALTTKQAVRSQVLGIRRRNSVNTVWVVLDAIPEFNAAHELSRIIVSITDLTAQRLAAQALRESEERFRTLVRDLHVAVVLSRPDGRIEFANATAYTMFGVPEGTAIGKTPSDLGFIPVTEEGKDIPEEDRPVPQVVRTRAAIENGVMGVRFAGTPGKIQWVFGNAVPQFDAEGSVIRVITAFSDITEMKNAERAIHQLSTQLVKLQDEERRRIGRELHDGLAQTVLAINLNLAQARQSLTSQEAPATRSIEKARQLTQQMSREIRTLSYLLHPPLLDDLGLVSTLKEYVHGFSERSGIETQLVVDTEFERLPQLLEIALFRIVQESLANIQRHSGSATAEIRLTQNAALLRLEVIDNGHGFRCVERENSGASSEAATDADGGAWAAAGDEDSAGEPRLGVGIPGMRERMAQLGGELDILSSPQGTTVRATISLPPFSLTERVDAPASHLDRG